MSNSQSSRYVTEEDAPLDYLSDYGISASDVEGLKACGINTCKDILQSKMYLTGVVRDGDSGLAKIRKAAVKLLKDWYPAAGREMMLKGKATADSSKEVIVKNLPYRYDETQLKGIFKKYAKCVKLESVLEDGLFKGTAKALFQSSEDARKALAVNGTTFFGRELEVEICGQEQNALIPFVVVKKLPSDITMQEVKAHFSGCGGSKSVKFTKVYHRKHRSAFIHYGSQSSIEKALELNGSTIREDHQILVEMGRPDMSRVSQSGQSGSNSGPIRRLKDKSGRPHPY